MSRQSPIDVDELLRQVRKELGVQSPPGGAPSFSSPRAGTGDEVDLQGGLPELRLQPSFVPKEGGYKIGDFTGLHYIDFINAAFHGILGRAPDPQGLHHYLGRLERGESKASILARIRYSREGRNRAVHVRGLRWRYELARLSAVPIVGYVVDWLAALLRLPRIVANLHRNENYAAAQQHLLAERANLMLATARQDWRRLHSRLEALRATDDSIASESRDVLRRLELLSGEQQDLLDRIESLDGKHEDARKNLESAHADMRARIGQLDSELRKLDEEERAAAKARETAQHEFDDFYAAFEEQFRGTKEDIMERLAVYLPELRSHEIDKLGGPVLDIGCGRGEWLELLGENGYRARGVDLNRKTVAACAARGLDVQEGEGLAWLRSLPDASLACVTAFHVVEHLPYAHLLALLREIARVLCNGGIAILETPNPANVLVGSHTFYLDPTHRNPLPADSLQFAVWSSGLRVEKKLDLHPYPGWAALPAAPDDQLANRINTLFYGPQDYAVIAVKP